MSKLTVKELRKIQVGQWVRTKWDDVGSMDTLVIKKTSDVLGRPYFRGFFPASNNEQSFETDQIVAIGNRVTCKDNGL